MTDEFIDGFPLAGSLASGDRFIVETDIGGTPITKGIAYTTLQALLLAYLQPYYSPPRGYLWGLTLANNATDATNDIDISSGECRDLADSENMVLAATLVKRLDAAWAVGTNQGGLDTGSVANNTYHVWLIKRSDTGVVDALFSLSATAPTMPANYTYKRRIGSIVRSGGVNRPFQQDGDLFMWKQPINDVTATNPGTAAVTRTLSIPTGIRVEAFISVASFGNAAGDDPINVYISDLSLTDVAASNSAFSLTLYRTAAGSAQIGGSISVMTNTSAQVRSRIQNSTAGTTLYIVTKGWKDTRGKEY